MRIVLLLMLLNSMVFAGKLNVVATIPDIGDMLREIGGDKVKLTVLATGKEDLHAVPVRPSFLPKLNRAKLLFVLGLDAEHAWLPALVRDARNRNIAKGQKGWIDVSKGIEPLNVPKVISRAEGEQHPLGNPHVNLSPSNGFQMAENIFNALVEADPKNKEAYVKNYDQYVAKLRDLVKRHVEARKELHGKYMVSYHEDVNYMCHFYEMKFLGTLEPKPGVPPTASHVAKVTQESKAKGVNYIAYNPAQSKKLPLALAEQTGAPVVELAHMVGAINGVDSWIKMMDYNLNQLLENKK